MVRDRELSIATTDEFDLTSLTIGELPALVPSFEVACWDSRADWTRHGRQRQARRSTTEQHGPLPTPADRLWLILVDFQQHPAQLRHGRLVGMRPSQATHWMPVFLPGLRNPLRTFGDVPSRSGEA